MTRFLSRAAVVAGLLAVAPLVTRALAPAHSVPQHSAATVQSWPAPRGALTAAATYVAAVNTVDVSRTHGDLTELRKVALPVLATAVAAARPEFTAAQLTTGVEQHARVVAVAGRGTQHGAVVTVTAALTTTTGTGVALRSATAMTLTVTHTSTGWRVSGVRA